MLQVNPPNPAVCHGTLRLPLKVDHGHVPRPHIDPTSLYLVTLRSQFSPKYLETKSMEGRSKHKKLIKRTWNKLYTNEYIDERQTLEGMSQHFHIWRDKQTIQGLWPNCIWRDKQNQEKDLVFESKTGKPKCILHKNSLLCFFQTYTTRRVAYLCIFLYMKSLVCRRKTMCHNSIPSLHSQSLLDYKTATTFFFNLRVFIKE